MRPKDVDLLCGDAAKIKRALAWEPKTTFSDLVKLMVEADLRRWKAYLEGNPQPWDAPNYPDDVRLQKRHVSK
jgi:GDPmannose 4,6-dehydratase